MKKFKEILDIELKAAMKARFKPGIRTIRAIKAEITNQEKAGKTVNKIALLQKLLKQRQDSFKIYTEQNRDDLAILEAEEMDIINLFLPKQLTDQELSEVVTEVIAELGATSMKDMGLVMGKVKAAVAGQATGSRISTFVKQKLS